MKSCSRCEKPTDSHVFYLDNAAVDFVDAVEDTTTIVLCHSCYEDLNASNAFEQGLLEKDGDKYSINRDAVDELNRVVEEVVA
jgi:hypothetical protein